MESTSTSTSEVKTFRGRSLEELLPQIRAELGPDAIVLRRREGLTGGVGGFFQRPFVEVDARAALPEERPLELRSDRATAEGMASPAVQALFEQATPFADALAAAAREARTEPDTFSATVADPAPHEAAPAGLYGPQPNIEAIERAAPMPVLEPEPGPEPEREPEPEPAAPEPAAQERRPAAARTAEERLVTSGLSAALAADVVGEAVAHGLPFSSPRNIKKLVRTALARRIPVLSALGPGPRTLAVIGGGGAGKTSAVAHIAAAYAGAGADIAVISLRGDGTLNARLQPLGIGVIAADDAEQAKRRLGERHPFVVLIDTPAAGPGHGEAHVKALAADLAAFEPSEVHLALPATLSAAAAEEISDALAALAPTHVALTHADETARPGAPIELALNAGRPLSYVCTREAVVPADPATLAQQLLP
jgi:flagellar biosynthesis GTPase FlhF